MSAPRLVTTRDALASAREAMAGRVAVVMTMGALHQGHRRLMQVARERADSVVVTIFVNPLQFAAGEDLERYPRTFDADLASCAAEGVDVVFAPGVEDIYPEGEPVMAMTAGELGARLEGAVRPTHFDGVLTVVARLLRLIGPDLAVFGEKDAQQLALIRRMVAEQGYPVEIVGVPIVREPDGLALSSRNRYLRPEDRAPALVFSRALAAAQRVATEGLDAVLCETRRVLDETPQLELDYLAAVDEKTWQEADPKTRNSRILVAGRIGATRLIDNVSVVLGTRTGLKE